MPLPPEECIASPGQGSSLSLCRWFGDRWEPRGIPPGLILRRMPMDATPFFFPASPPTSHDAAVLFSQRQAGERIGRPLSHHKGPFTYFTIPPRFSIIEPDFFSFFLPGILALSLFIFFSGRRRWHHWPVELDKYLPTYLPLATTRLNSALVSIMDMDVDGWLNG